jgi:hypothetical protein
MHVNIKRIKIVDRPKILVLNLSSYIHW